MYVDWIKKNKQTVNSSMLKKWGWWLGQQKCNDGDLEWDPKAKDCQHTEENGASLAMREKLSVERFYVGSGNVKIERVLLNNTYE